ncbi:hypothetical protein [Microvirga antarctica]|uniref:hypothetical protein n=1 Tax=Microvirga antarctica TaxID=2819233 RepID=UPI001B315706|nr:hypothetical protein [Microvirga antarctica]
MRLATGLVTLILLSAGAAQAAGAKDCRAPHLPGKVPIRTAADCDIPAGKPVAEQGRLKQENGFIDLGNGTQVRVGGRVRVDAGVQR